MGATNKESHAAGRRAAHHLEAMAGPVPHTSVNRVSTCMQVSSSKLGPHTCRLVLPHPMHACAAGALPLGASLPPLAARDPAHLQLLVGLGGRHAGGGATLNDLLHLKITKREMGVGGTSSAAEQAPACGVAADVGNCDPATLLSNHR